MSESGLAHKRHSDNPIYNADDMNSRVQTKVSLYIGSPKKLNWNLVQIIQGKEIHIQQTSSSQL